MSWIPIAGASSQSLAINESEEQIISEPGGDPSVAVTESCTGGLLAMRIVDTPGSGEWFEGGLVAYTAEVKHRLLGVPKGPVIKRKAAMVMAHGVRTLIGSDIGVATTGVAGPDREEDQPVGTMYVGISTEAGTQVILLMLSGTPADIRQSATDHAFQQVLHARASAKPRADGPRPLRYDLAIPEGGFAMVSPYQFEDVSIIDSSVAFTVANGDDPESVTIAVVGLDGGPSPAVLLSETGAEPMTPGRLGMSGNRLFDVVTGSPLGITWNITELAPVD